MKRSRSGPGRRAGAVSIELALLTPLLVTLLFAVVEFGFLFRSVTQVQAVAREAARDAGAGDTTTTVTARANATAAGLTLANMTLTLQYRTLSGATWGSWQTLTDSGSSNAAPSGAQVSATVAYDHYLIMPRLFPALCTDTTTGRRRLTFTTTFRRQ